MTCIETRALVRDDRTMTIQLPTNVEPGEHSIVLLLDTPQEPELAEAPPEDSAGHFRQEGSLRVFTGKLLDDPTKLIKQIYAEREHRFIYGPCE